MHQSDRLESVCTHVVRCRADSAASRCRYPSLLFHRADDAMPFDCSPQWLSQSVRRSKVRLRCRGDGSAGKFGSDLLSRTPTVRRHADTRVSHPRRARNGKHLYLGADRIRRRRIQGKQQTAAQSEGRTAEFLDQGYFLCRVGFPWVPARSGDGSRLNVPRRTRWLPGLQIEIVTETVVGRICKNGIGQVAVRFIAKKSVVPEHIADDPIPAWF